MELNGAALSACPSFHFVSVPFIFKSFTTQKAELQPQTVKVSSPCLKVGCRHCLSNVLHVFSIQTGGSSRSKNFKLQFIRPEYPIPLFSHPILVLPCKFQSFHLTLWSQRWFPCCNSAMETYCYQPSVHSAAWDANVQACSHFILSDADLIFLYRAS